jgi:UDP-N-acetylmuramoyl-L-alanyl-D-glutamate--2,6-diaminopimelate ligase
MIDFSFISTDSRMIKLGGTFVAITGMHHDGRAFIEDAISNGARKIILEAPRLETHHPHVDYEYVENARLTLCKLARQACPYQPEKLVAVTGTNGKSSVAYFYNQLLTLCSYKTASIGTIGVYVGNQQQVTESLTSPDALSLHQLLTSLYEQGVSHAIVEASSHGLDQYRLHSANLTAAAFTNLTPDHLDYHQDFNSYFTAKKKLFSEVLPQNRIAILNADIGQYDELALLCKERRQKIISYGLAGKDIKLLSKLNNRLKISLWGREHELIFPLLGDFQVANALCALGLALACGLNSDELLMALSKLHSAPGRLEQIATYNEAKIIIDYAHTKDALVNILTTLRKECPGKLHLVIGSGGDRDLRRRVELAQVANVYADNTIITDDNPRSEPPEIIRQQMLTHCPNALEIPGRAIAIAAAVKQLQKGDILVIAGKGHENYQIIGNEKLYFSDKDEVLRAMSNLKKTVM